MLYRDRIVHYGMNKLISDFFRVASFSLNRDIAYLLKHAVVGNIIYGSVADVTDILYKMIEYSGKFAHLIPQRLFSLYIVFFSVKHTVLLLKSVSITPNAPVPEPSFRNTRAFFDFI